ncbi:aldo/keto reductase [Luedemannella helvata]|uniref:Aldo/keto reductase n=1 Tax=Luedemannella helvata TaxID=349315 RepID=A0ABP4X4W3_9ACTN
MRIALGTIPLGSAVSQRDSFAILDRFVDAGGTLLDTANNYPFWVEGCTGDESEATIGAWLAARGSAVRDRVFVGTKVGARPVVPGDRTLDNTEGLSAAAINAGIEGSLRRLRTDRVDLYWAHVEDRSVPLEETLGAFHGLVSAGKVRELGASNLPTWRLERARARAATPYTHVQLRHTYLRPRPGVALPEGGHTLASEELLGYVREEPDLTLWAYNTLMFGAYTRADRPIQEIFDHPGTTARLAVLREVAGELGVTVNQVVLAWLLADNVVPIVGVSTMDQLEEAIGAADVKLDASVLARLDAPA